tara:strand:+ start:414 stop:656 length:243 start_codon:yes stop_codon:yes gene_type:complete
MNKLLLSVGFMFLMACSGNQEKTEQTEAVETEVVTEKTYACPMQCEGDKQYHEAGTCPVCHMDLQEVALADTDTTQHSHE